MPALAIAPADLLSSAPQSTASNSANHEGLFASHLKNATDHQNGAASSSANAAQKQRRGRTQNGAQGAKKTDGPQGAKKTGPSQPTDMAGNAPVTAANPNTPVNANAAAPQPASALPAAPAPTETGTQTLATTPPAAGSQRESVMTKLLAKVAAGTTAAAGNSAPAANQPPVQQTAGQAPAAPAQLAGDATKTRPAAAGMAGNPAASAAAQAANLGKGSALAATAHFAANQADKGASLPQAQTQAQGTVAIAVAGQQPDGQMQNSTAALMQDTFGQQFSGNLQTKAAGEESDDSAPSAAATTPEDRTVDVNGNYIRSRLPKNPGNTAPESEAKQNAQTDSVQQSKQQKPAPTADAMKSAADIGQRPQAITGQEETSPLLFAGQQQAPGPQPASLAPIASMTLHLPSGMTVPDSAVVDQMLTYFSTNRQLESGMVTIRLYPEELGELRMEIKVAQDNIKAHIVAQNPQAQEMINRHLPRLREALEQQNLHLQQVEVSVAVHNQTGNGQFQESNAWRQSASSSRHEVNQADFTQELDDATDDESAANILSVLV